MAKPAQLKRDVMCGNPRLHIHFPDNVPSWKVYGPGVANMEVTRYERSDNGGSLGINMGETYFARPELNEKRDTTKTTMLTLDRRTAEALYAFLGEWLA